MKVLLIDDVRVPEWIDDPDTNPDPNADRLKYSESGHDIEIARTGEEGCEKLKNNKYDVLLLDHDMGSGMNGMGVIRFLDDNPHLMPPKIYLVTANMVSGPLMMEYLQRWFKDGKILRYDWISPF